MFRDPAMGEPRKRITRMRYTHGPMGFLSDQIMKELQRAGYPPREFQLFRDEDTQRKYYKRGTSKTKYGAHQVYGAADIIHERWAWFDKRQPGDVPDGTAFWNTLWDCVEVVSEKYNVTFSERLSWDPAHVQLDNWKEMREVCRWETPTPLQLEWYFQVTLPAVWKQHLRSMERAS